ncbi:MAG: NfeD family protein [Turicibacter sp.]|nr:NfeD family protein [Turicibacter sp.]
MLFWFILMFALAVIIIIADIFLEVFGPIGFFGLLLLGAALYLTYTQIPNGPLIVLGKLALLIPIAALMVALLRKKKVQGRLFLQENLAEDLTGAVDLNALIGKTGTAITALRPYGHADFEGTQVEVRTESSYILAGTQILGMYVKDNTLFVKTKIEE